MSILDTLKKKTAAKGEKPKASKKPSAKAEKKTVSKDAKDSKKAATYVPKSRAEDVLLRPHITEKASTAEQAGVYVFEISKRAGKNDVRDAIVSIYGKTPSRINVVNLPSKNVISRGKRGVKSGVKKAYVYFKKGTTIEVM